MSYTQTLITVEEAASMLAVKPKRIYNRECGTEKLTRVKLKNRGAVRLIRQEVEAHIQKLIKLAQNKSQKGE